MLRPAKCFGAAAGGPSVGLRHVWCWRFWSLGGACRAPWWNGSFPLETRRARIRYGVVRNRTAIAGVGGPWISREEASSLGHSDDLTVFDEAVDAVEDCPRLRTLRANYDPLIIDTLVRMSMAGIMSVSNLRAGRVAAGANGAPRGPVRRPWRGGSARFSSRAEWCSPPRLPPPLSRASVPGMSRVMPGPCHPRAAASVVEAPLVGLTQWSDPSGSRSTVSTASHAVSDGACLRSSRSYPRDDVRNALRSAPPAGRRSTSDRPWTAGATGRLVSPSELLAA